MMLAAGAFRDEQWKMLTTARVEGGEDLLVLQDAMEKLSPQEVAERVRLMLEANSSLLDEETSARLMELLEGLPIVDGHYVKVETAKCREAPRLTDGDR